MVEQLGKVESLTIYPLTGARGVVCDEAALTPGGLAFAPGNVADDHAYVLYRPDPQEGGYKRIGAKQCRELAQLVVSLDDTGGLHAVRDPELVAAGARPWEIYVPKLSQMVAVNVVEFGDVTPCGDMGDEAANGFSRLLGEEVCLARKTDKWLAGGVITPRQRATATLHVGLAETIEDLADTLRTSPNEPRPFGADRLRAQLVVRGFPAFSEVDWVDDMLFVGDEAIVRIDRLTKRCPVPGLDPRTGENLKDVPKTYRAAAKAPDDGKPTIGVYGHAANLKPVAIRRGDEVQVIRL